MTRRRCLICLLLVLTKQLNDAVAAISSDHRSLISALSAPPISTTRAAAADDADDNEWSSEAQLDAVLSSLEAAFRYMSDQAANLNLDALIGTRMVEGTEIMCCTTKSCSHASLEFIKFGFFSLEDCNIAMVRVSSYFRLYESQQLICGAAFPIAGRNTT